MPRGIDHLVLCVNDLKKARIIYETMGFTMTPQAQHPFGTGNTLVQLDGCFLEVLSVTKPEDIFEASGEDFSFPAFNRDYLKAGEGMSMLVLDSRDEQADRAEFLGKDLHVYPPFEFKRQTIMPSGEQATVGFSLTFLGDPALKKLAFFTCKQWRPDLFWKPEYQHHANGALTIADVFVVAPNTKKAVAFLAAFADAPQTETAPGVVSVNTTRGNLSVFTPDAFNSRFPNTLNGKDTSSAFFAGFDIKVDDIATTEVLWAKNEISYQVDDECTWLAPSEGFGCVISLSA